jgi:hypothetical protein
VARVRRRLGVERLERRDLTAVVLVDIDSGALDVPQYDGRDLIPYVAGGLNFLGGTPAPSTGDDQGAGGHGSWTAAAAEYALQSAGLHAPVIPLVAIDSTGQASPYAVTSALRWVAAVAKSDPATTYVTILPIQGFLPWKPERAALRACVAAGAIVSVAAGNYGLDLDTPGTGVWPASYGAGLAGALVATATDDGQALPGWADRGPRHVQVAAPSMEVDYGHPQELASSGAAGIAAGWLAAQALTTGRPASMPPPAYAAGLVWAVEASAVPTAGTAGLVGYGVLGSTARPKGGVS